MTTDPETLDRTSELDLARVLRWYSGKARERVAAVLPAVAASARADHWLPRVSRGARAALSRQSTRSGRWVAPPSAPGARPERVDLSRLLGLGADGRALHLDLTLGCFQRADEVLPTAHALLRRAAGTLAEPAAEVALAWAEDFAPVARLFARLDASRARPTYELGDLSPTVRANVGAAMGLAFATVRMPEIKWELREVALPPHGGVVQVWHGEILWPEGTRHNGSRYATGTQCHACGHRISRSDNWVPLVLEDASGAPSSLWVGRDCAKRLFGCRVVGEARGVRFDRG